MSVVLYPRELYGRLYQYEGTSAYADVLQPRLAEHGAAVVEILAPTIDLSLAWGSNSQRKTDFRRDYRTSTGYRLDVDGDDDVEPYISGNPRHELVRHRCGLTTEIEGVSVVNVRLVHPRQ